MSPLYAVQWATTSESTLRPDSGCRRSDTVSRLSHSIYYFEGLLQFATVTTLFLHVSKKKTCYELNVLRGQKLNQTSYSKGLCYHSKQLWGQGRKVM